VPKRVCATCQHPIKLITTDGRTWLWVHDGTLLQVLRQAARQGVPAQHSLLRQSPIMTKEASIGEDIRQDGDAA
jgi:hypothetical protein